jgi:hypothetical protein
VYRCMHDRRMSVEMKGGCEGYGVMPSMAEGSCGAARQVRERAEGWRLGYSGDSGGGLVVVISLLVYWCIKGRRDD